MTPRGRCHRTTRARAARRGVPIALLLAALVGACKSSEPEASDADRMREIIAEGEPRAVYEQTDADPAEAGPLPVMTPDGEAGPDDELARARLAAGEDAGLLGDDSDPFAPVAAENPYVAFGSRIIVHDSGLITKPFPLPLGKAQRIVQLMRLYATFDVVTVAPDENAPGIASEDRVIVEILENWDLEYFQDLRKDQTGPITGIPLADWLLVTTGHDLLHEVQDFINLFLAEVPQIEIEAKIVEVTDLESLDVGVSSPNGGPVIGFPENAFIKSLDYTLPNIATNDSLLTLGAVQDGLSFNLLIEAAETLENVEISSMPKIAVREGARAEILNTQELPSYNISGISQTGSYSATLVYKEVGVKLFIVPRLVGTDTVALYIDIEASNQIGEQVFFIQAGGGGESQGLTAPVIANRKAKTVVYLKPGEGVILGGLTSERTVDNETMVPILGRIPILGFFFRSSLKSTERSSVLFFLRPRVLSGIDMQREF
jgi:type II secretory pathway component GspD/PulD (secretin)